MAVNLEEVEVALNGKLNEREELVCIKSILKYKEGHRYKFRFDPPDAIYIYYPSEYVRTYFGGTVGNKFLLNNTGFWNGWNIERYNTYFITLSEYRKQKLQKINSLSL